MGDMNETALPTDPRPTFFAAADQAVRLIGEITLADLGKPTPCAEFDVRTLAGHMVAVLRSIEAVARGVDFRTTEQVADLPGEQLAPAAAAARDAMVATWSGDVLDKPLLLPPGIELPGRAGAARYTQELATHAWDLAAALGREDELDPAIAETVADAARRFVPREGREHLPFGPVVEVDEAAGPYERLVGWLGRDPKWPF